MRGGLWEFQADLSKENSYFQIKRTDKEGDFYSETPLCLQGEERDKHYTSPLNHTEEFQLHLNKIHKCVI